MDWTVKRKLIYLGTFFGIILLVLGVIVYRVFFTTPPTCFDGKKNQDEQGIDCGGVCELVCKDDTLPLVPLWTRAFNITGDVYSVVSLVENRNIGSGVKNISYTLELYDKENRLIGDTIKGSTFVLPNGKTAIFETGIKTGEQIPVTAFLNFTEFPVSYRTDEIYNTQNIVVANNSMTDMETAPKLVVDITNVADVSFENFPVVAILYNSEGNAIAVSQTIVDEISFEETKPIYFSWPGPFDEIPVRREIIPLLNPFESYE